MKISACILTYNSASKIEKLLKSLSFVDEIVVVDGGPTGGSTDNTLEIVRKYTNKIYSQQLTSFGKQRNFCAEKASNNWILALDSDEYISNELKAEIIKISQSNQFDGYFLPRLTFFAGKPIRHSDWYPDYAIRLYDKTKMSFKNSAVHEKIISNDQIGYLKHPLKHYSYSSVKDYFGRFKKYSAMQIDNPNVPKGNINLLLMLFKPIYRFLKMYFIKLGFLDGWRGLFLAIMSGAYDGRVHFLAEKKLLQKRGNEYIWIVLILIVAFSQGFLISKFGALAIGLPLFLAILALLLFNLKISLFVLIFSIVSGQVVRIYLSTGGGIVLSDLVVPIFVMMWLFYKAAKEPKLVKSPIDLSLGLLLLIFIATFLLNLSRYFDLVSLSYLLRLLFNLALFWPLYDLLRDKNRLKFVEKTLSYLFYTLVGLGVLQLIFAPFLFFLMPYGWDPHLNRMVSTFLDPNFLAPFLCIGFTYFLAKFYSSEKPFFYKIWPLVILGLAIIFTFSRSGYLMLAIILLVFALFKDRKILIIGLLAFLVISFAVPRVKMRIMGGFNLDTTASYRIDSWKSGVKLIQDNFWQGAGYNNLISARLNIGELEKEDLGSHGDAGNDSSLIVIWATTGVFGFLIFLFWYFQNIYYGFRAFFKKKEQSTKNLGLAVAAILLGLLVNSFFNNTLLYPHIIILLMLVLAIFYNYYNEKNA